MIEVFKTDVTTQHHAKMLLRHIHKAFIEYKANFDLHDCDKILRVQCNTALISAPCLIDLLKTLGFFAEVLPDKN